MIKKVLLFGDFIMNENREALKSASLLRLSNMFRKNNLIVKQIHHCTSFTKEELQKIIKDFAANEEIIVCVSTSFMTNLSKKNFEEYQLNGPLSYWSEISFKFLLTVGIICKEYRIKLFMGGWPLTGNSNDNESLGYNILSKYYDYFVVGNNINEVVDICNDKDIVYEKYQNSKIIRSNPILDYSDMSSTPLVEDNIQNQESLLTEIASGCIFSCSFCNYASLGKKKHEFMRSYESLKEEIVSNYNNFGTRVYTLTDNIMNDYHVKLEWLKKIREETDIDLRWTGYVRLDTIKTEKQVQLLKESGIASCVFGIESLKKEVGPYFGKVTDKNRLLESLKIFRGVLGDTCLTTGSFIAGAPTETKEELEETFQWLISDEGKFYFDSYFFTPLIIYDGNNDKNEINKSRNNPFKDYEIYDNFMNWKNWKSPWGTSKEFSAIINRYNSYDKFKISGFKLPIVHNYEFDVEDIIYSVRNNKKIDIESKTDLTKKFIQNYKSKILGEKYAI